MVGRHVDFLYNCVNYRMKHSRYGMATIQYFTLILTTVLQYICDNKTDATLSILLSSLGSELYTVPLRDLLLQYLVDQLMLLDHCQAFEFWRLNVQRVHGPATTTDVLHLSLNVSADSHLSAKSAQSGSRCRPPAPDLSVAVATLQPQHDMQRTVKVGSFAKLLSCTYRIIPLISQAPAPP
jgi:hypothetical protein